MNDKTSDDRAQRAIPPMTGAVNLLNKLLGSDDIKTSHKARLRTVLAEITAMQQRASEPAAAQEAVALIENARAATDFSTNYATAKPDIGNTEKEHILGLCRVVAGLVAHIEAAPVAAAPVDLDAHGLRALDNCIADLRRLLELSQDYDLDVMQMQSLETAIESMELRKVMSTPAAPGIDLEKFREPVNYWHNQCSATHGIESVVRIRSEAKRLLALIDASPNGDDVQDGRFPGGLADAITYADAMEDAAADLYQHVLGYETDGSETGTDMLRTVLRELRASSRVGRDVRESIASVIAELESAHVQNNKYRIGCLGADNIDTAVRLLTALQANSAEVGS